MPHRGIPVLGFLSLDEGGGRRCNAMRMPLQSEEDGMAYGQVVRVGVPIEAYQALHKEITGLQGTSPPDGAILHLARATEDGFEVIDVWESKEQADAFNRDVVGPATAKVGAGASGPEPQVIEFEPATIITYGVYDSEHPA